MTSPTAAPPDTAGEEGGPPPTRRRTLRLGHRLLLAGALVVLWLAAAVVLAGLTVHHEAPVAQRELEAFQASITAGDVPAASRHLEAGQAALARTDHAVHGPPVRLVGLLPGVGDTVDDLDHLVAAVDVIAQSGSDALRLYEDFSRPDSELFQGDQVNLKALARAQRAVRSVRHAVTIADGELRRVHGRGVLGDRVVQKKSAAQAQLAALRARLDNVSPAVAALPSAVGADGPRTYLVVVMNPAEMRASGGAPLAVAFVKFADGKMTTPLKGTTSDLTDVNQKTLFTPVKGDPWQRPGAPQRFVNTTFNPSFPVAAEEMIRSAPSNFHIKPDGVIALDIVAVARLLAATGPIHTDAYGDLTAENLGQKLLIDAYHEPPTPESVAQRHDINDQLMEIMLARLTEGQGMIQKMHALREASPGRHLQMYFHDDRLQQLVADEGLSGAVPQVDVGNLTAVYTQNTNQSKIDVFQHRTVRETVQLREDGSAVVHRSVEIVNATPRYVGGGVDPKIGYNTRWCGQAVISLMPRGARLVSAPVAARRHNGVRVRPPGGGVDQDGRPYGQVNLTIPPHATARVSWTYVVPHAATVTDGQLVLRDVVAPQSMLNPPALQLTVLPPTGWTVHPAAGWRPAGTGLTLATEMGRPQSVAVVATR